MAFKQAPPLKEAGGLKLCELGQVSVVPAGTRIVSQGETPDFFYVIQAGRVQVFRETPDHIRTRLTELGPGAYFGEVALVTGQPCTATVEAMEESTLIKVSKEEFDHLLDHNLHLSRHSIQQLSAWLVSGDRRQEIKVVHPVKLPQTSWFDYFLMLGLSIFIALMVNKKPAQELSSPNPGTVSPPQEELVSPPTISMRGPTGKPAPEVISPNLGATPPPQEKVERRFVASTTGKYYHYPDCQWAKTIPKSKLIVFKSVAEAQKAGYKPCPVCNPHDKN
jgi:cyclic nucleotide-binding protein/metal binding Ada-like protein